VKTAIELFASADAVLLDFDGPICSVFAKTDPRTASKAMVEKLHAHGYEAPSRWSDRSDPHAVLRDVARQLPKPAIDLAERELTRAEVEAIKSATLTDGLTDVLEVLAGRPLAIVSNNAEAAVRSLLAAQLPTSLEVPVLGRPSAQTHLMKPSPYLVQIACQRLRVPPAAAVFVGDSSSDIAAGITAGVMTVGYANKPHKRKMLSAAGADAVVTHMSDLVN
jgi:HAD superfamily hydrolase (TIGR01509 family)